MHLEGDGQVQGCRDRRGRECGEGVVSMQGLVREEKKRCGLPGRGLFGSELRRRRIRSTAEARGTSVSCSQLGCASPPSTTLTFRSATFIKVLISRVCIIECRVLEVDRELEHRLLSARETLVLDRTRTHFARGCYVSHFNVDARALGWDPTASVVGAQVEVHRHAT